jgi:ABC-type amino acid transport substrate-binding protein
MLRNQKNIQAGQFRLEEMHFDSAWYRFIFPKGRGWEPVITQLNHRLEKMKTDGSLKAILDQYR